MSEYLSGRAGRTEWWLVCFVLFPVMPVLILALSTAAAVVGQGALSSVSVLLGLLSFLWPLIVTVRRFHDRGRSRWWVLISLVPVVGMVWIVVDCGILSSERSI